MIQKLKISTTLMVISLFALIVDPALALFGSVSAALSIAVSLTALFSERTRQRDWQSVATGAIVAVSVISALDIWLIVEALRIIAGYFL
jgi:hypothetical protein